MKLTLDKKIAITGMAFIVVAFLAFGFWTKTRANPTYFPAPVYLNNQSASTSVTYLVPGLVTTTPMVLDAFSGNNPYMFNRASIEIQFAGSSTQAVLNAEVQHSDNCIDYYTESIGMSSTQYTSSSTPTLGIIQTLQFVFASSTINRVGVTNANSATSSRIAFIDTPTRCTRVIFWQPIGSTNGAVWAVLVPVKEVHE